MTLDEGIKRNKDLVHTPNDVNDLKDREAIQLGIEALEWIKWRRTYYKQPRILLLPSETES